MYNNVPNVRENLYLYEGALEERGGEGKRMIESGASVERGRRCSSNRVDDRTGVKE